MSGRGRALRWILVAAALLPGAVQAQSGGRVSVGFVYLRDIDPSIRQDTRYAEHRTRGRNTISRLKRANVYCVSVRASITRYAPPEPRAAP